MAICTYLYKRRDETTVSWVKAHAEDAGAKTSEHEQQNKRAAYDTEKAYTLPDSSLYRVGYCSQFDTVWGAMFDGKVVVRKTGATVLRPCKRGSTSDTGRPGAWPVPGWRTLTSRDTRLRVDGPERGIPGDCPARITRK